MMNIAATYIRQGSFDDAIEIYQQIAKKDPNNEEVRAALTRAYAMFAGVNPETAVTKKAVPKAGPKTDSEEQQRLQREARERAQQEAQARAQRSKTPTETASAFSAKPASPESDLMQSMGAKEDEIAGDHQDEFMTVTVAEIYTKQGLLNEALKIYQKILEIEPGNLEAQMKKQELENTMAEQERLRQQSEEAARKKAEEEKMAAEAAARAALAKSQEEKIGAGALAAESVEAPESLVSDNVAENIQPGVKPPDDNPEPPGRRRGHVSYV
ncbi:MAG: tetratricopeptide repeat protein [Candidatus Firestonebacteria bacterium]|nr:tetratricopeptide repeat protein [Candidatus Firestonebacteria bacterium]